MNRFFLAVGGLVWSVIAVGCGGCCGTGPEYRDFAVPEGKSMIYLYKLPKTWGGGGAKQGVLPEGWLRIHDHERDRG